MGRIFQAFVKREKRRRVKKRGEKDDGIRWKKKDQNQKRLTNFTCSCNLYIATWYVHGVTRATPRYPPRKEPREEKGAEERGRRGRRNGREEDEASEIRLETSNLPESPASCNYHVCQPTRAPSPFAHPFATYPCVCHTVGHPFLRRAVAAVVFISPFTLPPRLTVLLPNLPPCLTLPIRPTARLAALPTPHAVRRATPDRVPTKLLATPDDSGSGNRDSSKRRTSPVTRAFSPRGCDRLALPGTLAKRAKVEPRDQEEHEIDPFHDLHVNGYQVIRGNWPFLFLIFEIYVDYCMFKDTRSVLEGGTYFLFLSPARKGVNLFVVLTVVAIF